MIYKITNKFKKRYRKTQINIPIYTATVLLCLTLISTYLTAGIYARYAATGQSFDFAKTISFGALDIIETGDFTENNMLLIPGVNINKKATVNFEGSNSAAYVFLEISVLPSGRWNIYDNQIFTLKLADKEILNWKIRDKWMYLTEINDGRYIFYQQVEANTFFNEDIIEQNIVTINDFITNNEMKTLNIIGDINIKFRATAVQSIGFDSPAAAWDSITD